MTLDAPSLKLSLMMATSCRLSVRLQAALTSSHVGFSLGALIEMRGVSQAENFFSVKPIEAKIMTLEPLTRLFQTADGVIKRLNRELRLAGIVVCQADLRTNHARDVISALRKKFGADVCDAIIRENTLLAEAVGFRKPITLYDPKSSGAQDYRQLAVEFEHRVGQTKQRKKVNA